MKLSDAEDTQPLLDARGDVEPTAARPRAEPETVRVGAAKGESGPGRPGERMPSRGGSPDVSKVWTSGEIADMARHYDEETTDPHEAGVQPDPVIRRLISNLSRRPRPASGPMLRRRTSDGADYVVYSGTATPAAAHTEPLPRPKVVLEGRDAPTELLPKRSRAGSGKTRALVAPWLLLALGVLVGAVGSRWIDAWSGARRGSVTGNAIQVASPVAATASVAAGAPSSFATVVVTPPSPSPSGSGGRSAAVEERNDVSSAAVAPREPNRAVAQTTTMQVAGRPLRKSSTPKSAGSEDEDGVPEATGY
jgi:hypothetical protein